MKSRVRMVPEPPPGVELLEGEWPAWVADLVGDDLATRLPTRMWRDALLAPVEEMLSRRGKGFRARLVDFAWKAGGGQGSCPAELPLLVEIIHAGSLVIDDIEDQSGSRRGAPTLHKLYGVPVALNAGNWMYFVPFMIVRKLGLKSATELKLVRRISTCMFECHYGQALDISARIGEVPQRDIHSVAHATSKLKTGSLMALAAAAGSVSAGAPPRRVSALAVFGRALGIGLQMLDDLGDLSGHGDPSKRWEDLRFGRVNWPWAWLSRDLEVNAFAALQTRSRELQKLAGTRGESGIVMKQAESLARVLGRALGRRGRERAHRHLEQALGHLGATLGGKLDLVPLRSEISRLESSYG